MIRSNRNVYVGFNLTKGEKEALRTLAKTRGTTMSDVLVKLVQSELSANGIKTTDVPEYTGEPLPLG
jgi:hypothetical protein